MVVERSKSPSKERPADTHLEPAEKVKASVVQPQTLESATSPQVIQATEHTHQTIIDGTTGEVITEPSSRDITKPDSGTLQNQSKMWGLRRDHSEDILRLAAINDAFREGLLALQALNLDDDLYWRAVEDLRRKYYAQRNLEMSPK